MLINYAFFGSGAARSRGDVVVRVSNKIGVPRDGGGPKHI